MSKIRTWCFRFVESKNWNDFQTLVLIQTWVTFLSIVARLKVMIRLFLRARVHVVITHKGYNRDTLNTLKPNDSQVLLTVNIFVGFISLRTFLHFSNICSLWLMTRSVSTPLCLLRAAVWIGLSWPTSLSWISFTHSFPSSRKHWRINCEEGRFNVWKKNVCASI